MERNIECRWLAYKKWILSIKEQKSTLYSYVSSFYWLSMGLVA